MILIVFPSLLAFLYELWEFIANIKAAKEDDDDEEEDDEDEDDELSPPHPTNAVAEIARVATSANVLFNLFMGSFPP